LPEGLIDLYTMERQYKEGLPLKISTITKKVNQVDALSEIHMA